MAEANDAAAAGTPTDITKPTGVLPGTTTAAPDAVTATAPVADDTRIALPPRPPRQPIAPETFRRRLAILDNVILLPLLVVFAAFVAAKPVRNSDVLMHLATGRALVEGKYNPFSGQDPFAHTTTGVRWVNHSWLFDVLLYGLYQVGGIKGLAVVRCLVLVVLAVVLVRVGRSGRGQVGPVLCTALALVAMRPRLLLQPFVVSLLFLGLTLWLLQRGGKLGLMASSRSEEGPDRDKPSFEPVSWKNYWPLLLLFALWVNLDEWFFLGPLTVGLYALGQFIQAKLTERRLTAATPRPGEVRALGLIFVLGWAVCLVNPQHVFALQLPVQLLGGLAPEASTLSEDGFLKSLFFSPFNERFFRAEEINAASLAYFPLALLGLLSFALEFRNLRWARLLPFVFFLALSAWHQRAVPFFAVVAAPLMALNFQDALRRGRAIAAGDFRLVLARQRGLLTGRVLAAFLLVLVLGAAWPGWLEARPLRASSARTADYRVALADEIDPSLRRAALWFKEQRDKGTLPADLGFNASPEIANAFAWYCPDEKVFFDFRFHLFSGVAGDYVNVRKGLEAPAAGPGGREDWEAILKERKVDHLVLYHRNPEHLQRALLRLWQGSNRKDWVPLYLDGRTAVFGWARERPAYNNLRLDPLTEAYAPAPDQRPAAGGMTRLPAERPFWLDFTRPLPQRSLGADEALLHLTQFEAEQPAQARRNLKTWQLALVSGIVGGGPQANLAPGNLVGALGLRWLAPLYVSQSLDERQRWPADKRPSQEQRARFATLEFLRRMFMNTQDAAPPEHLLLAARAARRGLAGNPEDALGLAHLGATYFQQLASTREKWQTQNITWIDAQKRMAAGQPRPLAQLRLIQAVTALEQALLLRQDLPKTHAHLAQIYASQGYPGQDGRWHFGFKDLELLHLKAALKHARRGDREDPAEFDKRLQPLRDKVKELQTEVDSELDGLELSRKRYPRVLHFAQQAWDRNLGGKALQLLLDSNLAAFGPEGARLQIELALTTGRVREVSKWFEEGMEDKEKGLDRLLGPSFSYPWWRAMLAAATGDYAEADKHLLTIARQGSSSYQLNNLVRGQAQVGLISKRGTPTTAPSPPLSVPDAVALLVGKALLDAPQSRVVWWTDVTRTQWWAKDGKPPTFKDDPMAHSTFWVGLAKDERAEWLRRFAYQCSASLFDEAQVNLLRGMLALEQGDTKRAAEAFGTASGRLRNLPRRLPVRLLAEEHLWNLWERWGLRPFGLAQR